MFCAKLGNKTQRPLLRRKSFLRKSFVFANGFQYGFIILVKYDEVRITKKINSTERKKREIVYE